MFIVLSLLVCFIIYWSVYGIFETDLFLSALHDSTMMFMYQSVTESPQNVSTVLVYYVLFGLIIAQ